MEMASYLAGERWSDHPRCTHPLLASVARLVNDVTSDRDRRRLVELIPSVIGLTTNDPRADVGIALRCATTALPIASAERQNVLAVSVLAAERTLATLEGRPPGRLSATSMRAMDERAAGCPLGPHLRQRRRCVRRRVPPGRRAERRARRCPGDRRGGCARSR